MTELDRAIRTLRRAGLTVTLAEGEAKAALWNVGPLVKLGYYEVIRLAAKTHIPTPQQDASMIPLRSWPNLGPAAFK